MDAAKLFVGIGLTNDCNLECPHCYRDTGRVDQLTLQQIRIICEQLPVQSMGFGTGESGLHPEFVPIVEYLQAAGVKLSVASNGYTLTTIPDSVLRAFHDVEVSIDFANRAQQDAWRGPGNWLLVHRAIERCHALRVEVSILNTMLRTNYTQMDRLVHLARRQGANLRVNAYQPVHTDAFSRSYQQFWEGYRRLFDTGLVLSCTEPVVRAAMGLDQNSSPCGQRSIRFNPRGQVIPCVYWPVAGRAAARIEDLPIIGRAVLDGAMFQAARLQPASARGCPCRGGCASRRALNGCLDDHDAYCPWVRGEDIRLDWRPAPTKDLLRSANVCTTLLC